MASLFTNQHQRTGRAVLLELHILPIQVLRALGHPSHCAKEETIELSTCVPPHHRAAYGILLAGRQAVAAADCAADKYPHSRAYVLLLLPVHPWLGSKLETAHHQRPNRAICVQFHGFNTFLVATCDWEILLWFQGHGIQCGLQPVAVDVVH